MVSAVVGAIASAVAQGTVEAGISLGLGRAAAVSRRKAAQAALTTAKPHDIGKFAKGLTSLQGRALCRYVSSSSFSHLVLQTAVATLTRESAESATVIREQAWHGLRHTGAFAGEELTEATDFVLAAVALAVQSLETDKHLPANLAIAADIAAAGIRNSRLLADLESLRTVDDFADAVCRLVAERQGKIRVSHAGQTRVASYDQLYVEPDLCWLYESPREPVGRNQPERLSFADILDQGRCVVLGHPGAGKSTLAGKLVHDVATAHSPDHAGLVPFLLVVRDHSASLRTDHETLVHYLAATCRRSYQLAPPPDVIEYLLLNGRALVVIDGLDELGDSRHRDTFVAMVDAFAHNYPTARIVVTSRLVGYEEATLDPARFAALRVAPFDVDQVERYALGFFTLDERFDADERSSLVQSFLAESSAAADLRCNALMLSLLCTLYASANYIPRNKPELYEKCAELLFETWDRSRGIDVPHRFSAHIKPAVQRLAWQLFNDSRGRQALPRAELAAELTRFLHQKRFEDLDDARQAADDFIKFCAGRAWVLTEVGSDRLQTKYGFVHRTFLEYFAASQFVKNDPQPASVWSGLRDHVTDGSRAVFGELAVQLLDRWNQDGADELLRLALQDVKECVRAGNEARVAAILAFCVRCLESVSPGNAAVRELTKVIVWCASSVAFIMRRPVEGDTYQMGDIPFDDVLIALLRTPNPDLRDRVHQFALDAATSFASALPQTSSAGAICLYLNIYRRHSGVIPKDVLDRMPSGAKTVYRLAVRPSPEDVAEGGVEVLFRETHLPRVRYGAPYRSLFRPVSDPDLSRQREQTLIALYTPLVDGWSARIMPPPLRGAEGSRKNEFGLFDNANAEVCGAELLLSLAAFDCGRWNIPDFDPRARIFAAARSPQEARKDLNGLNLPQEVVELAIEWKMDSRRWLVSYHRPLPSGPVTDQPA